MASDGSVLRLQDAVNRELVSQTIQAVLEELPEDVRSQLVPSLHRLQLLWLLELSCRGEIAQAPGSIQAELQQLEALEAQQAAAEEEAARRSSLEHGAELYDGLAPADGTSRMEGNGDSPASSDDEGKEKKLGAFERLMMKRRLARSGGAARGQREKAPEPPRFRPAARPDVPAVGTKLRPTIPNHHANPSPALHHASPHSEVPPTNKTSPTGERSHNRHSSQLDVTDFLATPSLTSNIACGDTVSRGSFMGISTLGTAQGDGRVTVQNGFITANGHTLYFERLGIGASQGR